MLEYLFSTVLRMSAGGVIVIPVVMLIRQGLKKMPRIWSYVLWLLVLARLLCPVLPEISLPAFSQLDTSMMIWESYTRSTPATRLFEGPGDVPAESVYADPDKMVEAKPSETYESGKEPLSLQFLLAVLWLTGAAAVLICGGVSMGKLKQKLRSAVPLEKGVYAADHIETSFVTGILRPRIYLPSDLPEEWADPILRHERQHIRRMDPFVKSLYFLALVVHWFNPMVWVAYRLMTVDMEMSCDEAVTRHMNGEGRKDYAQALLCLSTGRRSFASPAFGEGDTGNRIRNVLNPKSPRGWMTICAVLLCIIAAVLILSKPVAVPSGRMEYPGFSWGDSPEAVMSTLKDMGSNGMILDEIWWEADESHSTGGYAFQTGELEMFGQRASSAVFRFVEYTWNPGQLMLGEIVLYYPDGHEGEAADLEALERKITDLYGEPIEEIVTQSWYPGQTGIREERTPVNPHFTIWESKETAQDILTEEEIQAIYDRMIRLYTEDDMLDELPALEAYRATFETPVARIRLRDTYFSLMGMDRELSEEARAEAATDYVLTLSGQTYLGYLDVAQSVKVQ